MDERSATSTAVFGAILRRPKLWRTALSLAVALRRNHWWRRPPFLPLAPKKYLRFRYQTAYGDTDPSFVPLHDVMAWLDWCKAVRK